MPGGGDRSPDVAWVEQPRWDALTSEQKRKFLPLCPDFMLELFSPSDNLRDAQAKMREYRDSGAQLGWLIHSEDKQVKIYRSGQAVEVLEAPATLSEESVLSEFTLNLESLWK